MDEEGDAEDFHDIFDKLFASRSAESREQQAINHLLRENDKTRKKLQELRSELVALRRQIRSVKNAAATLLGPIVLGGIVLLVEGWSTADSDWGKFGIVAAFVFAVWWIRDVGRQFDDATS